MVRVSKCRLRRKKGGYLETESYVAKAQSFKWGDKKQNKNISLSVCWPSSINPVNVVQQVVDDDR